MKTNTRIRLVVIFVTVCAQIFIVSGVLENKPKEVLYAVFALLLISEVRVHVSNAFIQLEEEAIAADNKRKAHAAKLSLEAKIAKEKTDV